MPNAPGWQGCLPVTSGDRHAAIVNAISEAKERGIVSETVGHHATQLAHLGFAGDDKALELVCLLSRWVNEIEAGTSWEWAFSLVKAPAPVVVWWTIRNTGQSLSFYSL